MNYGMYLASSGALTALARQNVAANNLANVATPGFRPDLLLIQQRDAVRIEDNLPFADSNALLERLGAGVIPAATRISLAQGALRQTDQPLDLALRGDGFFMLASPDGAPLLTRDGRFTTDNRGRIVRASDGAALLSDQGAAMHVDPGATIDVHTDGSILADGRRIGRIAIRTVPDPSTLIKAGHGIYKPRVGAAELIAGDAIIKQYAIEESAVNPISALMAATAAAKAAQSNLAMVGIFNDTMGRAINTLGRVS